MSIPSGRQLLIIGRFAEYLLASGALVVQTCGDIHELNIEIFVIVESVWDFNTTSQEKLALFYIINLTLDSPLLDVSVRGFGEKMLGSPCRPLSSIFEDVTQTTNLQSTLFFRYVTDFSLCLFRQTKLIIMSSSRFAF